MAIIVDRGLTQRTPTVTAASVFVLVTIVVTSAEEKERKKYLSTKMEVMRVKGAWYQQTVVVVF
jgi:hypothetical protein